MKKLFRPTAVIAVDVDGTIVRDGKLNSRLVQYLHRHRDAGFDLMLWSARGGDYARKIADHHNITDLFSVICGKPGFIIDDRGWRWTADTRVIRTLDDLFRE